MPEFIPTPEQQDALSTPAPLLILAGAGTGKTTVVTHRIAQLVTAGEARPGEILALTFADKAAAEMGERLAALMEQTGLGEAGHEIACRTFHSFGADIVREYAPLLGIDGDFRVLSTPEAWRLLSRIVDSVDFHAIELPMGSLGSVLNGLLGFFSAAKDHLVGPDELDAFITAEEEGLGSLPAVAAGHLLDQIGKLSDVAAVYRAYEGAKQERSFLDYGDLLTLPIRLLREHPDVREGYQRRFRHLFVDEYQDTNYSQRTLLLQLLSPEARVVVIGDDDQSIYGWRGAVIRNILDFPNEPGVRDAGSQVRYLTVNRRSGSPILDIANAVISRLPDRYPKRLNYVEGVKQAEVGHYVAASDVSEARWIARRIEELRGTTPVEDPTGKKRGYGVFAVLCRKRSLFGPIAHALEDARIPYELVGGSGFYGRWEVRDILSYLRVLANPADNIAMARVLQSASWRISDRDLFHLSEWSQSHTRRSHLPAATVSPDADTIPFRLIDAIAHAGEIAALSRDARERLERLSRFLDTVARLAPVTALGRLVEMVIEDTGYRRELSTRTGVDSHLALLNLGKLVELARQFEDGAESLDDFVEYVQFALESGGEESEVLAVDEASDAVKVMTVHAAKGLEFPAVFVPGLAARLFPGNRVDDPDHWSQLPEELKTHHAQEEGFRGPQASWQGVRCPQTNSNSFVDFSSIQDKKQLKAALDEHKESLRARSMDEERRLFYVAITRAQRALYLSRACWYGSNTKPRDPSTFWDDVMATGLSTSLGEEAAPASNPNLLGASNSIARASAGNGAISRLLLTPDKARAFVEAVAVAHPAEWAAAQAEADQMLAAMDSPIPLLHTNGAPVEVSCSGLIEYARCPRLYRYCYVERLPRRPSRLAALGVEVHRVIEAMSKDGRLSAPEDGDESEPDVDEREHHHHAGHQGTVDDLLAEYGRSEFATRQATMVEEPFLLPIDGNLMRGRVDRLDRLPDGTWRLADFKASRYRGHLLDRQLSQMRLYALAAWRLWEVNPGRLTCRLLFLVDGHQESLQFSPEELETTEAWAARHLSAIRSNQFPLNRTPDSCTGCDYSNLC